jgi:hypothetical protein
MVGERPRKELEASDIDFDLFSAHDYIVLIIQLIPGATSAACLILIRVPDTDVYNRAGVLILDQEEENLKTWVQTWERKTITIV